MEKWEQDLYDHNLRKAISVESGFGLSPERIDEIIEKARGGVYKLTGENKKLGRVGQKYGEAQKPGLSSSQIREQQNNDASKKELIEELKNQKKEIIDWMNRTPHPSQISIWNASAEMLSKKWTEKSKQLQEIKDKLDKHTKMERIDKDHPHYDRIKKKFDKN